ncbi:MAG: polyhydroxyalkanoate depolymerase, partial [Alphaproteobacteria bacterium]|nr:polyhydroxyalkanoate depolymerase [Alphaproteobacteria bacterium]
MMLYDAYQAQSDLFAPLRAWAGITSAMFARTCAGPSANYVFKSIAAASEILNRAHLIHDRPSYEIESVEVDGSDVPVIE